MTDQEIQQHVQCWLESIVIELNLCPFAKRELVKQGIRFVVSHSSTEQQLLDQLNQELAFLDKHPDTATTLLIHPDVLVNFHDYNQFLDLADDLLLNQNYQGIYQIASFHPDYQFANTKPNDSENYTNRSPYPILHLLREHSVEHAIANYPNSDEIPQRNIELLNEMGADKLQALLADCFKQQND